MLNKEDLNQILDRNVAWIENCDSKASIMLGMLGVTISIVFAFDYAAAVKEIKGGTIYFGLRQGT